MSLSLRPRWAGSDSFITAALWRSGAVLWDLFQVACEASVSVMQASLTPISCRRSGLPMWGVLVVLGVLAGCPSPEPSDPPAPVPIEWSAVAPSVEGGAVFSIWAPAATDVWAVGGEEGRPLVLRYDGTEWSQAAPPQAANQLWWVHGVPGGPTMVVGNGGASFKFEYGVWSSVPGGPPGATLYGVWMASATDGWAVGGPFDRRPDGIEPAGDVLLRYINGSWVPQTVPALTDRQGQRRLFKVWASAPDDVFVVGSEGLILHFDGQVWSPMDSGVNAQLFTVSGRGPEDVWVVGGGASGVLLHYDGKAWTSQALPEFAPQIIQGVHASQDRNDVLISGFFGFTARLDLASDTWEVPDPVTQNPLHSITADPIGRLWAGGGDIAASKANYTGVIIASDPSVPTPVADASSDTGSDVVADTTSDLPGDLGPEADVGPVSCGTPATICPGSIPHTGAPCEGELSCPYAVGDVLNTIHTASCDTGTWTITTACDPALGGGCDVPPLAESCIDPFGGTLANASVAVGPRGDGAFTPYVDGSQIDLVWGGQGSPMFEFRVELDGDGGDALTCANVKATIDIDGVPTVDASQPVVFRCGSTLGVFVIVPASPIDCDDKMFQLDITIEVQGVGSTSIQVLVQGGEHCFG